MVYCHLNIEINNSKQLAWLQKAIYGHINNSFESRLLLITSLILSIVTFFITILNIAFGLNWFIVASTIVGTIVYGLFYFYGRNFKIGKSYLLLISIFSVILININWYYNYGSKGSVLPLYVVMYSLFILIWEKKYYFHISLMILINLILLFLFEWNFPEKLGTYPDPETRLKDIYFGLGMVYVITYWFTSEIKKNYILQYERAKKSDQLKSAFIANMSHEIRTPLNAIVGFSSLIADYELTNEEKEEFREQINNNSEYLLNLIEDIIDVSKIESNQLKLNKSEVNVNNIITNLKESFEKDTFSNKEIQIITAIEIPDTFIWIDRIRLEQILRNLVSNAIKFTSEGTVEIGVKNEGEKLLFWVKDSGIGIKKEDQKMIFNRFVKVEGNKQVLHKGTGIGLFLSKQLVEMFGGKIWVESEYNVGSIFYFTLPT